MGEPLPHWEEYEVTSVNEALKGKARIETDIHQHVDEKRQNFVRFGWPKAFQKGAMGPLWEQLGGAAWGRLM